MSAANGPWATSNGLLLSIDAGNRKSYPRSGTAVSNMVGGTAVTLVNGPTYSDDKQGKWNFDGTNDYADFSTPDPGSTATIEMWMKLNFLAGGNMIIGWYIYSITTGGGLGFTTGNFDEYGLTNTQITNLGLIGNWKHYVFEMRSDVSYTNNKIYVNGVNQTLSQVQGTENSPVRTFNSGAGRISAWGRLSTGYNYQMDLGVFNIYNRSLTQTEINQNYSALRSRFL